VVFRADPGDLEIDRAAPVLEAEVAGAASTWTPALDGCLEPGGVYAWTVRAHFGDGASAWAEARLFALPAAPTPEELESALAVVERYLAARSGAVGAAPTGAPGAAASPSGPSGPGGSFPFGETFYIADDGSVVGNAFVYSCGLGAVGDYWRDFDGDGYGSPDDPTTACAQPPGYVANEDDCDDDDDALALSCLCDPLSPDLVCGGGAHCEPQSSGDPQCVAPVGAGGQGAACATSSDCQAEFYCREGASCSQWCRVGGSDCSVGTCNAFSVPRYIGGTEWGGCS